MSADRPSALPCPNCHGVGVAGHYDRSQSGYTTYGAPACPMCEGEGTLPIADADTFRSLATAAQEGKTLAGEDE